MSIEERTEDLLRFLKSCEHNLKINNNEKEEMNFYFKLTGSNLFPPSTEIIDKEDYEIIKKYIIKEFNHLNFTFHFDDFDNRTKFLHFDTEK